jgi:hypothetical protein
VNVRPLSVVIVAMNGNRVTLVTEGPNGGKPTELSPDCRPGHG